MIGDLSCAKSSSKRSHCNPIQNHIRSAHPIYSSCYLSENRKSALKMSMPLQTNLTKQDHLGAEEREGRESGGFSPTVGVRVRWERGREGRKGAG